MDDLLDLLQKGPDPSIIVFVYLGDLNARMSLPEKSKTSKMRPSVRCSLW